MEYFDERSAAFRAVLHAAREYFAVEGIHHLRVEIKRLRLLYELIDYMAPAFASKPNYSSLRNLFRAAGELRDIDIYQAITLSRLKTLDLSEYFNYLKNEELHLRKSFINIASAFSDAALTKSRRQIYSALAIASDVRLQRLIAKKISNLVGKMNDLMNQKKQTSNRLHAVRKLSKSLRYTLDIWQVCYGKATPIAAASDQLKITYRRLGDWRDTLLVLESVSIFLQSEIRSGSTDPAAYAILQNDLQQQADLQLARYSQGRGPLQNSLDQLASDFQKQLTQ